MGQAIIILQFYHYGNKQKAWPLGPRFLFLYFSGDTVITIIELGCNMRTVAKWFVARLAATAKRLAISSFIDRAVS